MIRKRGFRWLLFLAALISFCYVVFVRRSPRAVGVFFATGGGWYWLERRKMRELDAPRPKSESERR